MYLKIRILLSSSNERGFIGYQKKVKKKYCVVFDNIEFYFDKDIIILTIKKLMFDSNY